MAAAGHWRWKCSTAPTQSDLGATCCAGETWSKRAWLTGRGGASSTCPRSAPPAPPGGRSSRPTPRASTPSSPGSTATTPCASSTPASRKLFELPPPDLELPAYRERFAAGVGVHGEGVDLDGYYDAQLLWDATMAESIADALVRWGGPVVHLNGGFHSDFDGGLTSLLRRRGLSVLTASLVPGDSGRLAPADAGRARVVIYTGTPQPTPATQPTTQPATQPTTLPATQPAGDAEPFARVAPQIGSGALRPATVPATRPAEVRDTDVEK